MLDWIQKANNEIKTNKEILSFHDYMELFEENPLQHLRPTYLYLSDMFNHYGKSGSGHYKLFLMDHPESPPVFGQLETQKEIYQNIVNFEEEGFNNKFILLVGPNGSAKSSIVKKIMRGAEDYSKTDDGALYTFSWIFPIDNYIKGSLGLAANKTQTHLQSYAYLEDKDVTAILNSELKDHPILLIPREYRQGIISKVLDRFPQRKDSITKSYLYRGDISKRNRMIYDALLKSYKGNHEEVLKHIRVERFTLSKRYSNGAVTIEPQLHVDAKLQQITMDKRLASLPPSLQSLNLFSSFGEVIMANRGILEFSDLLKRPLDAFKYLLSTMESSTVNLQGILTYLDIFFVGTSNELHLEAFKQHPDYKSFKGRFSFIRVPYLLNYNNEVKIYQDQVKGLGDKSVVEPHSIKLLCLFAIMTRLRAPNPEKYKDSKTSAAVKDLNPLEKALFLGDLTVPERFDVESNQLLKQSYQEIKDEYALDAIYEGKFGISPREMKKAIYDITADKSTVTFVEILEYLEMLIKQTNEFDFLNIQPQGAYHNPERFIELLKTYGLDIFEKELRDSLGLVDDRSYENYIKKYISNINALIKGEKILNEVTGKYEVLDEYFIKEFEKSINLKEDVNSFRSHLIGKLGAYYIDNPNLSIVYCDVFPDLVRRLQESFREEQNKVLKSVSNNIIYYEAEQANKKKRPKTPLSKENRDLIMGIIDNLMNKHGYSESGAITVLKFIIKTRF